MAKSLKKENWIGKKYGRWTVLDVWLPRSALALCECGTERVVDRMSLRAGVSQSCGCLNVEIQSNIHRTHGHCTKTGTSPTYHTWLGLLARCFDQNSNRYDSYAGRGITVCERWMSFDNFLTDMGERPGDGYSIERIDNNGNYEPGNCLWATVKEQARNRRSTFYVVFKGTRRSLAEHAEACGIAYKTAWKRIRNYGWSPEQALTTPIGH